MCASPLAWDDLSYYHDSVQRPKYKLQTPKNTKRNSLHNPKLTPWQTHRLVQSWYDYAVLGTPAVTSCCASPLHLTHTPTTNRF